MRGFVAKLRKLNANVRSRWPRNLRLCVKRSRSTCNINGNWPCNECKMKKERCRCEWSSRNKCINCEVKCRCQEWQLCHPGKCRRVCLAILRSNNISTAHIWDPLNTQVILLKCIIPCQVNIQEFLEFTLPRLHPVLINLAQCLLVSLKCLDRIMGLIQATNLTRNNNHILLCTSTRLIISNRYFISSFEININ